MKKYRLKQWYPSLKQDWSKGNIAEWFDGYYWNKGKVILNGLSKNEVENNPDFWELIEEKEPLFITEDGVEVSDKSKNVISIDAFFNKCTFPAQMFINENREHGQFKAFYHESNADEYIWRNKRVFSYNDIEKYQSGGEGVFYDVKAIAKERIEE